MDVGIYFRIIERHSIDTFPLTSLILFLLSEFVILAGTLVKAKFLPCSRGLYAF